MRPLRFLAHLTAVALFAGGTIASASRLELGHERAYDVDYIPKAGPLRWLSFGHPTLLGNFYWLRAVQYIGEPKANKRGWDKLLPLLDLVTDLDPLHAYAYQVGGTMLSSSGRIGESDAILEKGMRAVPSHWVNFLLRSFNAFYYEGDYVLAGEVLQRASQIPGTPEHLRENALAMLVKGKRADAAIAFLTSLRDEAWDADSRAATQKQLDQAILERDAAMLEDAISRYAGQHGAPPGRLEDLVADGLVPAIPADPYGGRYVLGADGRVHSSVHEFRFAPPKTPEELQDQGEKLRHRIEERNRLP